MSMEADTAGDLVHFLIINNVSSSCRFTIPHDHLQGLPSSYLSALSSGRWNQTDNNRSGTAGSEITVAVAESPEEILEVWTRYSAKSVLSPLIQRAYASAAAVTVEEKTIVLPYDLEMEDAVLFLKYYGLFPDGEENNTDNNNNFIRVPEDGPAAVLLRAKLLPKEAKMLKVLRDTLVKCIFENPERVTYFVFDFGDDNCDKIEELNSVFGGKIWSFSRSSNNNNKNGSFDKYLRDKLLAVVARSTLRDKLVSNLQTEDKLEAEFVDEKFHLIDPKRRKVPGGRGEQQTLVGLGTELIDNLTFDEQEELDLRTFGWRYVLKVEVPDL